MANKVVEDKKLLITLRLRKSTIKELKNHKNYNSMVDELIREKFNIK